MPEKLSEVSFWHVPVLCRFCISFVRGCFAMYNTLCEHEHCCYCPALVTVVTGPSSHSF